MGTELIRIARRSHDAVIDWNLDRPDAVRSVHATYAKSGAQVFLTNTFQLNPLAIRARANGRRGLLAGSFRAAVEIAASVAGRDRFVLADIGPIMSRGNVEFANPRHVARVLQIVKNARNLSGILFETCSSSRVRFAVEQAKRLGLPVLLSLTYRHRGPKDFETFDRHSPEWFAERARKWGADLLGVNCGLEISVADCAAIVRAYRKATDLPIFARPNAGTPKRQGDTWRYPRSPAAMARDLPELLEAGATMIGGCCGTTPAHIRAFRRVIDRWNARRIRDATL